MVVPTDNSPESSSNDSLHPSGDGVIIDIGTGDGRFVYQSARENPNKFYIGIDASSKPLEKISEKIHRRPTKGGAPNVLFIHAAVENLPLELAGVANEVHVHLPWGSLLKAVAGEDIEVLKGVRRICASDALLEVVLGLDETRDISEIQRLGLGSLTIEAIDNRVSPIYAQAGFEITERGVLPASDWPEFKTSWSKKLSGSRTRQLTYMIARAKS